jgi:hypothetical protein
MTASAARELETAASPAFNEADLEGFDDSDLDGVSDAPPEPPEPKAEAPAAQEPEGDAAATPAEPQAAAPAGEPAGEPAGGEGDDKPTGKEPHLPKSRYDYQRSKRREAEQRNEQLEAQLEEMRSRMTELEGTQDTASQQEAQAAAIADIEGQLAELDVLVEELRADGKTKEIAAKQSEIRRLERKLIALETPPVQQLDPRQLVDSSVQVMTVRQELDSVVTQIEQRYPQLNDQSDTFDPDVTNEVMDLYDAFIARGNVRPAIAMERAVAYVVGPLDDPTPPPAAPAQDTRRAAAVERNVKAANSMPPDMSDAGLNSDRAGARKPIDIMNMSIEQYEALGDRFDEDAWLATP